MRKKSLFLFIVAPILLFVLLTQLADAQAARPGQSDAEADIAAEADQGEPLPQPLSIRIRQSVPMTIALGLLRPITGALPITAPLPIDAGQSVTTSAALEGSVAVTDDVALPDILFVTSSLTETPSIFAGIGVTLEIDLQVVVTQTLTSTAPANLIIQLSGMPSMTVPVSITFGPATDAIVTLTSVEPTPEITETLELTPTTEVTSTLETTATVTAPEVTVVTATVPFTANVRSEPVIADNVVRQASLGSTVEIVARNEAGDWLLLLDGNWIATSVVDNPPTGLPVATPELIESLRAAPPTPTPEATPVITPTVSVTPTAPITPTTPVTETETITPTTPVTETEPTTTLAISPTVTVNANLRGGPGTEFPVIGGTVTGQTINIVARNEDATWFLLDNGGWVSAGLVANAPISSTVPLFGAAAPAEPAATPTPEAPAAPVLPTPTPRAQTAPSGLTAAESLYLINLENLARKYERALASIDQLVTSAGGDQTLLTDEQWVAEMTTAIAILRSANQDARALEPSERFTAADNILLTAAEQYDRVADLLEAGVTQTSIAQLDQAFSQVTIADDTLAQATSAFNALRP